MDQPMLAASKAVEVGDLDWSRSWLVSPKFDGIRAVVYQGQLMSRAGILLPNKHTQKLFGRPELEGFDGELTVGDPASPHCINATTSGVNSIGGQPDVTFRVFDIANQPHATYTERAKYLRLAVIAARRAGMAVALVPQILCRDEAEGHSAVAANYAAGYEGSIIRDPYARYKHGRSTIREGYLLKVKEFVDFEVHVTHFDEAMRNGNMLRRDAFGHAKRSSHKSNLFGAGMIGTIHGIDMRTGDKVSIAPGRMTHEERAYVFNNQAEFIGSVAKASEGKHGKLNAPRFGRFIAWRPEYDIV